jgi:hypothetical protein
MKGMSSLEVTTAAGETTVLNEAGFIEGFILNTDGTNAATVSIYDGTAAGGARRVLGQCAGANRMSGAIFQKPIAVTSKINAVVTGTGATATILYSK